MRRTHLLILLLLFAFPFCEATYAAGTLNWTDRARRLTGESDRVRAEEIAGLRTMPGIEDALRKALGTRDQFLAFDVIVALGLNVFVPDLMEFSERDPTGYAYHALNAVALGADRAKVLALYRRRIRNRDLAPVAKMTLLDSLARTAEEISTSDLERLLADRVPEVRMSAIGYLRNLILRSARAGDVKLLAERLGDPADRLRLQALSIFEEIPKPLRRTFGTPENLFSRCRNDRAYEVQIGCARIAREYAK